MKNLRKSILSLVVILLLVASAFIPSYAATSQPASYSSESNSGQRDVICTTLDGTSASSYYTGSYQYDLLSTQSASDIKAALSTLMTTTHTNITSYNDCRDYVFQVDCQNNDTSRATTLYTSHQMTSSEWSPTWSCNREHVWPQSLGGGNTSGGGADLHHIRPAEASVNNSRGNLKFGDYIPADNVKGDVARICLYVMVRWGAAWDATDITQVFTSVDLLLDWCELDPVDTWEMGRNEVVEDIQGNRNVFIDYPEYAWLIFGEEVPDDMVTPSGEAMSQTSSGTPSVGTGNGSSSNANNSLGATAAQEVSATISFANTAQRTSHTTAQQVWTNEGVTFTNDKASSTTNVGDYSNPVRIYASSSITIGAPGNIKTITVVCSSNDYATVLKNSVGAEAVTNGSTVTITPTAQSTSYTVEKLTKQTRFKSITVVYTQASTQACTHTNTTTNTVDATCTTAGSITVTCKDCEEVISTTPLPTKDHNYVDGSCSVCGASKLADSMGLDGNKFYIATIRTSGNYFYMTSNLGTASTKRYQAIDSGLSTLPAFITNELASNEYVFVFEYNSDDGTYYIYSAGVDGDAKYLSHSGTSNSGRLVTKAEAVRFTVDENGGIYTIHYTASDAERYLALNQNTGSDYFAFYKSGQKQNLHLIPVTDPVAEPCAHTNTTSTTVDATCTQDGSITVTCTDCEEVVSTTIIPATGHNYVGGTCTGCGDTQILETLGLDGKQFYIFTIRTTGRYIYMSCDLGTASTKRYTAVDSKLTTLPAFIANELASNEYIFVFEYNSDDGTYYIYSAGVDGDAKYLGHDGSTNSGLLVAKADAVRFTVDENDGVYTIHYTASDAERYLALNKNTGSDYFAFYESGQRQELHLIPIAPVGACAHTSSSVYTTVQVTCTAEGETVSVCDACKNLLDIHKVTALGHNIVDGICARCGYTEDYTPPAPDPSDGGWTLVTDVSQLKAGDRIIIVSISPEKGAFIAGNISSSVMASVALSGSTITTLPTGAVEFTLGGSSGSWTFTNQSGQLLGATAVKKVAWGSGTTTWSISIDANGNATIQNSTEAYGRILYNVSYTRFTTYTSGTSSSMLLPQIYKYSGEQSDAQEDVKIYGASMTVGTNLAMNYYVSGCKGTNYYMVCTMNGVESEQIACEEKFGYLVFSFKNIPPQMMTDTISAMIYDSEGNALLDAPFEFSVKEYADKVLDAYSDNEDVTNIVADMLKYGAAAQKYIGYNLNSLVIGDGECDDMGSTLLPSASDNVRSITTEDTEIDTSVYAFTAAGVRFDFDNKIYVKFRATGDGEVTLKCNGKNAVKKELEDGTYIYYTDGISATDFDKVYTFELYVDGELHQTLVYSVNSYAYAKQNSQDTELADLVIALYRYGLSAKAYKGE